MLRNRCALAGLGQAATLRQAGCSVSKGSQWSLPCAARLVEQARLLAGCARSSPCPCSASAAVSGLEPHTSYAFRVRALNSVGASLSELESFRTAPAAPTAPLGLQLQHATPSSLALAWAPPRSDHGAPVTGYQLECARGGRGGGATAAGAWRLAYQGADLHAQVGGVGRGAGRRESPGKWRLHACASLAAAERVSVASVPARSAGPAASPP